MKTTFRISKFTYITKNVIPVELANIVTIAGTKL